MDVAIRNILIGVMTREHKINKHLQETVDRIGSLAIPALIDIMSDRDFMNSDSPGGGFINILAARFLAAKGQVCAIEPMLNILFDAPPLSNVSEEIHACVCKLLALDINPALTMFDAAKSNEHKVIIGHAIGECRSNDPRVFDVFIEMLRIGDGLAPFFLAEIGDPRAIPFLSQAFDNMQLANSAFKNMNIFEFADAIERLGGQLTSQQKQKLEFARGVDQTFFNPMRNEFSPLLDNVREKIGRNDPCICDSGKKYKKCCLRLERV